MTHNNFTPHRTGEIELTVPDFFAGAQDVQELTSGTQRGGRLSGLLPSVVSRLRRTGAPVDPPASEEDIDAEIYSPELDADAARSRVETAAMRFNLGITEAAVVRIDSRELPRTPDDRLKANRPIPGEPLVRR